MHARTARKLEEARSKLYPAALTTFWPMLPLPGNHLTQTACSLETWRSGGEMITER